MARGFNKVILMGNLARDPEIRYTVDKRAWARFTVAVGRQWKDRNGELRDSADFIPVVVWGPQAENCERFLNKGKGVLVEGRIQTRNYDDRQGNRRYVTEVLAQSVTFLGGGRKDESSPYDREGSDKSSYSLREKGFNDEEFPLDISEMDGMEEEGDDEADIPF